MFAHDAAPEHVGVVASVVMKVFAAQPEGKLVSLAQGTLPTVKAPVVSIVQSEVPMLFCMLNGACVAPNAICSMNPVVVVAKVSIWVEAAMLQMAFAMLRHDVTVVESGSDTARVGLLKTQESVVESVACTSIQYCLLGVSPVKTKPSLCPSCNAIPACVFMVNEFPTGVPVAAALHAGGAPVP